MFKAMEVASASKGKFTSLFTDGKRFSKYIRCILIGISTWFVIGVLITFSPEFAKYLNVQGAETIAAGKAIAWAYTGLVFGDMTTGLLSQWLKGRKKVMAIFLAFSLIMIMVYLHAEGVSSTMFYVLCMLLGFSNGYWVIFVTIAAEQFGTNMRATVTTTVPNFVRGSLPVIILSYQFFRDKTFSGNIIYASMVMAVLLAAIAFIALWKMKETFSADLDYTETI